MEQRIIISFSGLNLILMAILIVIVSEDISKPWVYFLSVLILLLNICFLIVGIRKEFMSGDSSKSSIAGEDKSVIMTDLDSELERRRAAKRFERN